MSNENAPASSNFELFLKTPNGIEAALRVNLDDIDAETGQAQPKLAALVTYMARVDAQLATANFKRSERLDKPARMGGGGRATQPPPTIVNDDGETVEVKCGQCGGAVYDNREENKARAGRGEKQRPIFACKNKDGCGWVQWPPKGGS
ncbi:MAG TPA: hypothetical protein VF981_07420 [Gemmatimonadaceae bacterium]